MSFSSVFGVAFEQVKLFHNQSSTLVLTLKTLFISENCIEIKIELNFYFHISLWCLKRFYEGLCENKNLT